MYSVSSIQKNFFFNTRFINYNFTIKESDTNHYWPRQNIKTIFFFKVL